MAKGGEDSFAYQWACLVAETYEQTAIRRGNRVSAFVLAKGPLVVTNQALEGTEKILMSFSKDKTKSYLKDTLTVTTSTQQGDVNLSGCQNIVDPDTEFTGLSLTTPGVSVHAEFDPVDEAVRQWNDAAEKLGLDSLDLDISKIKEYLKECLQCDFKLEFDWQMQPLNLLGPINKLLGDIEGIIDGFASRLDPFNLLDNLCGTLDGFRLMCVPDLINILLALQMLLKKYVMFGLDIKIDWTAIAGPLIKAIVDAIVTFLQQIIAMLLAPLDCAIKNMVSVDEMIREGMKTIDIGIAAGQAMGDTFKKDEDGNIPGLAGKMEYGASGTLNIQKEPEEKSSFKSIFGDNSKENSLFNIDISKGSGSAGMNIATGFKLNASDTLESRMQGMDFKYASPLQKVILMLREARKYAASLFDSILYTFKSLNQFMSGSLGIQLNNAGAIMLVLDMISLVKMLIKLIGKGSPDDWCQMLKDNPDLLRSYFEDSYPDVDVSASKDRLNIVAGPWEGPVTIDGSCAGNRTSEANRLVAQWISDLEKGMR